MFGQGGLATETVSNPLDANEMDNMHNRMQAWDPLTFDRTSVRCRYRDAFLYGFVDAEQDSTTVGRLAHLRGADWSPNVWIAYIGKCLATTLVVTHVRFLAGVSAGVDRQRTALDETLVAIFDHALVRPLVGVYAKMPAQIRLAIERLYRDDQFDRSRLERRYSAA